ncbi:MAG: disulfide bond formation protein B [Ramlibacter sp.]|uniref:disulfide bond formation protein B n=1 Tax=Ramlibacter sp. TaxID=1917967 RepID=UPI0026372522|nr:disulfide bond formation protein B [Ramlibacter sp.]MDH4375656.1 disulfide bond formation protein B [Ramlibacter sp.]
MSAPLSTPTSAPLSVRISALFTACLNHPRRVLAGVAAICLGLLAFGLYLQHGVGLNPCPMCIVQRYCLIGVALAAALGAVWRGRLGLLVTSLLGLVLAGLGAFTAARQSWLQWYPPQSASCGRDFYGMIESFPLQRAIPMIFRGSGDCSTIDWTFLGGTIANWSLVSFLGLGVILLALLGRAVVQDRGLSPAS